MNISDISCLHGWPAPKAGRESAPTLVGQNSSIFGHEHVTSGNTSVIHQQFQLVLNQQENQRWPDSAGCVQTMQREKKERELFLLLLASWPGHSEGVPPCSLMSVRRASVRQHMRGQSTEQIGVLLWGVSKRFEGR